jgi:hypothetical protein
MAVCSFLVSAVAGRALQGVSPRWTVGIGVVLIGVGSGLQSVVGADSGALALLPGLAVVGIGVGLAIPTLTAAAMSAAPPQLAGWSPGRSTPPGSWGTRSASRCSGWPSAPRRGARRRPGAGRGRRRRAGAGGRRGPRGRRGRAACGVPGRRRRGGGRRAAGALPRPPRGPGPTRRSRRSRRPREVTGSAVGCRPIVAHPGPPGKGAAARRHAPRRGGRVGVGGTRPAPDTRRTS